VKNYLLDSVSVSFGGSCAEIITRLQKDGWKQLQYVSHSSWGDCRSPEIMGLRPMTKKEIKERDKAIEKEKAREIKKLKSSARKYGFSLRQE